jgi:hypothetical protein
MISTHCYLAEGDVARAIVARIRDHNERVGQEADAIKEEIGAESAWFSDSDGRCKGFKFPGDKARAGFKEVRDGVKYPTQKTKEGKALVKRIEKLRRMSATSVVQEQNNFGRHWGVMDGRYICFPVGVLLPYKDEPKLLAKMSIADDSDASAPEGWKEIKEWEFMRIIQEWNDSFPVQQV